MSNLLSVIGLRAPFLRIGWNRQFLMMSEFGFVYDSSILAPFSDVPVWPYTLDYKPPYSCVDLEQFCPTRAYPGLWELPLNQLLAGVSLQVYEYIYLVKWYHWYTLFYPF